MLSNKVLKGGNHRGIQGSVGVFFSSKEHQEEWGLNQEDDLVLCIVRRRQASAVYRGRYSLNRLMFPSSEITFETRIIM